MQDWKITLKTYHFLEIVVGIELWTLNIQDRKNKGLENYNRNKKILGNFGRDKTLNIESWNLW